MRRGSRERLDRAAQRVGEHGGRRLLDAAHGGDHGSDSLHDRLRVRRRGRNERRRPGIFRGHDDKRRGEQGRDDQRASAGAKHHAPSFHFAPHPPAIKAHPLQ